MWVPRSVVQGAQWQKAVRRLERPSSLEGQTSSMELDAGSTSYSQEGGGGEDKEEQKKVTAVYLFH